MKKLFLILICSLSFIQPAFASDFVAEPGNDFGKKPCPKPTPCPECPKPPVVTPDPEARYSDAEHVVLAGFLSSATYGALRSVKPRNRLTKTKAYVVSVAAAVALNQALEPDTSGKKDSLNATLLGAALTPLLTFDF